MQTWQAFNPMVAKRISKPLETKGVLETKEFALFNFLDQTFDSRKWFWQHLSQPCS